MGGVGAAAPKLVARFTDVKVFVWWNLESCHLPKDCDPYVISSNIHSTLARMNYRDPISVFPYDDINKVLNLHSVLSTAPNFPLDMFHPFVSCLVIVEKDAISKTMLVDMLLWTADNPAPASYLLISGGDDFSYGIYQLFLRSYNILLVQSQIVSNSLLGAAKSVWLWTSLAAGGPPLSDGELQQLRNSDNNDEKLQQLHNSNNKSSSETLQVPVSNDTQTQKQRSSYSEVHDGNMNISGHATGKLERKQKQKLERKP